MKQTETEVGDVINCLSKASFQLKRTGKKIIFLFKHSLFHLLPFPPLFFASSEQDLSICLEQWTWFEVKFFKLHVRILVFVASQAGFPELRLLQNPCLCLFGYSYFDVTLFNLHTKAQKWSQERSHPEKWMKHQWREFTWVHIQGLVTVCQVLLLLWFSTTSNESAPLGCNTWIWARSSLFVIMNWKKITLVCIA